MFLASSPGCLLPFLILFNLFFGWLFFKPLIWLAVEGLLVFIFMLSSYITLRRMARAPRKRGDVIDVEAKVVREEKRLK